MAGYDLAYYLGPDGLEGLNPIDLEILVSSLDRQWQVNRRVRRNPQHVPEPVCGEMARRLLFRYSKLWHTENHLYSFRVYKDGTAIHAAYFRGTFQWPIT